MELIIDDDAQIFQTTLDCIEALLRAQPDLVLDELDNGNDLITIARKFNYSSPVGKDDNIDIDIYLEEED